MHLGVTQGGKVAHLKKFMTYLVQGSAWTSCGHMKKLRSWTLLLCTGMRGAHWPNSAGEGREHEKVDEKVSVDLLCSWG